MIVPLRLCRGRIALGREEELRTIVKKFPVGDILEQIMLPVKATRQDYLVNGAIIVTIPDMVRGPAAGHIIINQPVKILLAVHGGNVRKKDVTVMLLKIAALPPKTGMGKIVPGVLLIVIASRVAAGKTGRMPLFAEMLPEED